MGATGTSSRVGRWLILLLVTVGALLFAGQAAGEERFPPPEFRSGYVMPEEQFPALSSHAWDYADAALLAAALAMAVWLAFYKRSRTGMFLLTVFAVVWFGFVRQGCVCPIGAIQNVTEAAFTGATIPWTVALFFALPLIVAFLFGRVFCGGVCPLGAIQDLFTWKGYQAPAWAEAGFGLLAYLYLGLAVMYAALAGPYLICQYDPFVPMFRLNGPSYMFAIGAGLLVLGLFVGRPYCRFLCPYGVLLRMVSIGSWKKVRITPAECIKCRLCEKSCPFGAMRPPTVSQQPRPVLAGKRLLVTMLLASPVIVAVLAIAGYAAGPTLALLHRDVQLAQEVAANEANPVETPSDALKVFIASGESSAELYAHAQQLVGRFGVGGSLVGVWMGAVIATRLIAYSIRRRREDYTAEPGGCLACARCFDDCPVELKRRGVILELPVVQGQEVA